VKKLNFPTYEELNKVIYLLNYIEKRGNYYSVTNFKIDIYYLFLFRLVYIDQRQSLDSKMFHLKLKKRFDKKNCVKGVNMI